MNYNNTNWMLTREAMSWLESGSFVKALELIHEVNMPTTETLEIQGRAMQYLGFNPNEYFEMIKAINTDKIYWDNEWKELKNGN